MQDMEAILNRRYKLIEQIGSGGMALVYKAQDLSLGRMVAVKVLRESLTSDGDFLVRFQNEARAVANLAHPNIVTVHDFGRDGTRYYIVMEYIEGENLKSLIRAHAPFPLEQAIDLTIQTCAGVGYAHRAGLVHCDLKPHNVLVTPEGRVKVTDFGIARALATIRPGEYTDTVWGSPQYFSPEQAEGQHPTPASDVYSIGVVLFEMLSGRLPFVGQTPQQLAMMHMRDAPPEIALFNPNVPETVALIIRKILTKEPSARYRTADQLGRILVSYREQSHERTDPQQAVPSQSPPLARPAPAAARTVTPPAHPAASRPSSPIAASQPSHRVRPAAQAVDEEDEEDEMLDASRALDQEGIDWLAVGLGLLAVLAVLGLVQLWLFVAGQYGHLP